MSIIAPDYPPVPGDQPPKPPIASVATSEPPEQPKRLENPVVKRFVDAYRVTNIQDGLGTTIKIGSAAIGLIVLLIALQARGFIAGAGFVGAILVAGIGFVLGTLISAQAQLTRASLDSAVNTSPFLNNEERRRMMSL